MVEPGDLVTDYGQSRIAGAFDALTARYALPVVVAVEGRQRVLRDEDDLTTMLGNVRNAMLALGVTDAATEILHQGFIGPDLAYVSTRTVYTGTGGAAVTETKASYVVQHFDDDWRIALLSIDKRPAHGRETCPIDGTPVAAAARKSVA